MSALCERCFRRIQTDTWRRPLGIDRRSDFNYALKYICTVFMYVYIYINVYDGPRASVNLEAVLYFLTQMTLSLCDFSRSIASGYPVVYVSYRFLNVLPFWCARAHYNSCLFKQYVLPFLQRQIWIVLFLN